MEFNVTFLEQPVPGQPCRILDAGVEKVTANVVGVELAPGSPDALRVRVADGHVLIGLVQPNVTIQSGPPTSTPPQQPSAPPKTNKTCMGCLVATGVIIFLIIVCAMMSETDYSSSPESTETDTVTTDTSSSTDVPVPSVEEYQLQLKTWSWSSESEDFVKVEGQVTNLTDEKLENVTAVASFYDSNGEFITSDDALIDYNPILPGQTSPFSVISRYNPAMKKAQIEFKELSGGTLSTKYSK
ncbi:MAG: FxLYD domain-containing protein [Armatimonadota bacterium]|nr:FxLYD domain-containing protein [bacterium]